jgi:hypothetical protein
MPNGCGSEALVGHGAADAVCRMRMCTQRHEPTGQAALESRAGRALARLPPLPAPGQSPTTLAVV